MTMVMLSQLAIFMAVTMDRLILPVDMGMGVDMGVGVGVNQIPVGMKMGMGVGMVVGVLQGDGILHHQHRGADHNQKARKSGVEGKSVAI